MSRPRQVKPGQCYMSTRRTSQRQLLLRPDKVTNQLMPYCVGVAAERFGIELHALVAMSNTLVINYRDPHGNEPEFRQLLFSLAARGMNVHRDRAEAFWSSDEPSVMALIDGGSELDKMVYNLTDPVRQELVDKVHKWPGFNSLRFQLSGKVAKVKRPKLFFPSDSKLPDEVTLRFVRLPGYAHLSEREWVALLLERVTAVEEKMAAKLRAEGRRVVGCKAVLRRSPYSYPTSDAPRRNLNPRLACRDKDRRREAIEEMRLFQARHRAARERYQEALDTGCEPLGDILFPWGTYQLVRRGLVRCEDAPS